MPRAFRKLCFTVACVAGLLSGCSQEAPLKSASSRVAMEVNDGTEPPGMSRSGELLFKQYCSSCHPDGGNVSDPSRSLHRSALKRNHITAPEDIVRIMRKPLSRMIRFDLSTLSDRDARVIAEYILVTFK